MGSMRYVHVSCLNEWRAASSNTRSLVQCDYCGYTYNVARTRYAAVLESRRVVRATAALLLLLAVGACSVLLGPLGAARHFYALMSFHPDRPHQVGRLVAAVWCWQLDWLVSGLIGVGAVGVGLSARDQWRLHRHVSHQWLVGLVTALASHDTRIYRVFAALGFVAAARAATLYVEGLAKNLLTKWGTMILEAPPGAVPSSRTD